MINKTKLDLFINQQNKALKLLYDNSLTTPFLMVLFATIDIFGYISGKGFNNFVKKYMLENISDVNSNDLWSASEPMASLQLSIGPLPTGK